jgi:hypothetical protein
MNYFLLLLVSYLGLAAGTIISHMAKEEIKPGIKYFKAGKSLAAGAILFAFFLHLGLHPVVNVMFSLLIAAASFWLDRMIDFANTDIFYYGLFAILLFEAFQSHYAPAIATGIFVFGVIAASIKSEGIADLSIIEKTYRILLSNIIYLGLGLLLPFVF